MAKQLTSVLVIFICVWEFGHVWSQPILAASSSVTRQDRLSLPTEMDPVKIPAARFTSRTVDPSPKDMILADLEVARKHRQMMGQSRIPQYDRRVVDHMRHPNNPKPQFDTRRSLTEISAEIERLKMIEAELIKRQQLKDSSPRQDISQQHTPRLTQKLPKLRRTSNTKKPLIDTRTIADVRALADSRSTLSDIRLADARAVAEAKAVARQSANIQALTGSEMRRRRLANFLQQSKMSTKAPRSLIKNKIDSFRHFQSQLAERQGNLKARISKQNVMQEAVASETGHLSQLKSKQAAPNQYNVETTENTISAGQTMGSLKQKRNPNPDPTGKVPAIIEPMLDINSMGLGPVNDVQLGYGLNVNRLSGLNNMNSLGLGAMDLAAATGSFGMSNLLSTPANLLMSNDLGINGLGSSFGGSLGSSLGSTLGTNLETSLGTSLNPLSAATYGMSSIGVGTRRGNGNGRSFSEELLLSTLQDGRRNGQSQPARDGEFLSNMMMLQALTKNTNSARRGGLFSSRGGGFSSLISNLALSRAIRNNRANNNGVFDPENMVERLMRQ